MTFPTKTLHPDEKIKAGKLGSSISKVGIGFAILFLGLSLLLVILRGAPDEATIEQTGHVSRWARFLFAYVICWAFIASIAIGMMWLILLHFLVRGRWATVVRRIAEAMTGAFPIIWIAGLGFVLPVFLGNTELYYWSHPDAHNAMLNPTLQHKLTWLSPTFFALRYVLYGAIYIAISSYFAKKSREQDETGDPKITDRLRIVAGPMMIV